MTSKLYEVADNRTDPTPVYFLPFWVIPFFQGFLTNNPQDIIGNHCQFQHQLVAFKFPGWQSFNIHICLDLAVILLASPWAW